MRVIISKKKIFGKLQIFVKIRLLEVRSWYKKIEENARFLGKKKFEKWPTNPSWEFQKMWRIKKKY